MALWALLLFDARRALLSVKLVRLARFFEALLFEAVRARGVTRLLVWRLNVAAQGLHDVESVVDDEGQLDLLLLQKLLLLGALVLRVLACLGGSQLRRQLIDLAAFLLDILDDELHVLSLKFGAFCQYVTNSANFYGGHSFALCRKFEAEVNEKHQYVEVDLRFPLARLGVERGLLRLLVVEPFSLVLRFVFVDDLLQESLIVICLLKQAQIHIILSSKLAH